MQKLLKIALVLPGLLFTISGLRWLIDPPGAAAELGMDLLAGMGRSSQIGDMASFFLVLGFCIIAGVASGRRYWFYPAVMLLGVAAFSRVVAWIVHDAGWGMPFIAVEIVVACLLWFGSAKLEAGQAGESGEPETTG